MNARHRPILAVALAASLVASLGGFVRPPVATAASPFLDIAGTTFEADIEWLWAEGITVGCSPTLYCPDAEVSRGQMASFLVRMFDLTEGAGIDAFSDDDGTTHEGDIDRIAHAGITKGCTPTTFCPDRPVLRGEMATFLARAIPLTDGASRDYFRDDDGTTHEANIDRAAAAGIASGCYPSFYCPVESVTRGQMAGFLHRVVKPVTPPPFPAPKGPMTLHVTIDGIDKGNACFDDTTPCRTIGHALALAMNGDSVEIGAGTFRQEDLWVVDDLTITGDPGGGTIIHATQGTFVAGYETNQMVTMAHLTLTGGRNHYPGISCSGSTLEISHSTITDNNGGVRAYVCPLSILSSTISANAPASPGAVAGGISSRWGSLSIQASTIINNSGGAAAATWESGDLTIVDSTITGNVARESIVSSDGDMVIVNSTIAGNSLLYGRGIWVDSPSHLTVVNATIVGNVAESPEGVIVVLPLTTLDLINSVVAANTAPSGADITGPVTSQLASIIGVPAGLTLADILDPAGLQDNGGPTKTIALTDSAKNPAIGKGDAATCAADPVNGVDQRGEPRTPPCDIGAYELQ